jgi:hypothetical protein
MPCRQKTLGCDVTLDLPPHHLNGVQFAVVGWKTKYDPAGVRHYLVDDVLVKMLHVTGDGK